MCTGTAGIPRRSGLPRRWSSVEHAHNDLRSGKIQDHVSEVRKDVTKEMGQERELGVSWTRRKPNRSMRAAATRRHSVFLLI